MKQIQIIETQKSLATYKRHLNFLQKQVVDQRSLLNSTTDGNVFRRAQDNLVYWEEELAMFSVARSIVMEDQNDFIELVADLEDGVIEEECYVCDGLGFHTDMRVDRHVGRFGRIYPDCETCFGTGKSNVNSCKVRVN